MKRIGCFSSGVLGLMLLWWGYFVTKHRYQYDGRIPGWRDWGPYHLLAAVAREPIPAAVVPSEV
jgi:hypothetical protein